MQSQRTIKSIVPLLLLNMVFLWSCNTTSKIPVQRHYYDFSTKKLLATTGAKKEEPRPLPYRSSKDIQLEIFNYNPLRDEIIVEDSSSQHTVGDTATLARMIIFPTVGSLPEGDKKNQEIATKNGTGASEALGPNSAQFLLFNSRVAFTTAEKTDCEKLKAYMYSFNLQKVIIENSIQAYKELISKMEIISDDYEDLKVLDVLTSVAVSDRLANSFLARLNNSLPGTERVRPLPVNSSSRDLSELEAKYYKAVTDAETELDQLKAEADLIEGNCAGFVDLYKKFITAVGKVKDNIKEFKTAHTDKIIPGFSKKLLLYDEMKRYIVSIPNYVTKAISISTDKRIISIYKKETNSDVKKLHDYVNVDPTYGMKLDVAGGIFFSGLSDCNFSKKTSDSIYTKQYLVDGVLRDTTIMGSFTTLYSKEQSNVSYGGMLYLQAHSQNAKWVNWGGFVGFGAMFNDQTRWAGALGGSLLFGKTQQFNINVGGILAQVERLTPPYQVNKAYTEAIDNIPTYKAWDVSMMIGFSWSFR